MNRTVLDLWVGFFVAIGIAAVMFLALKVGNLSSAHLSETYVLQAKFDNIGGLKVRSPVKIGGVYRPIRGDQRGGAKRCAGCGAHCTHDMTIRHADP